MSLNIKNPRAFRAAHELAEHTGESLTEAVTTAIEDRLRNLKKLQKTSPVEAGVADLQAFVASLPDRDARTPDEVIGYDAFGLLS
ncbi:MAG: type II toxin-antitoxin system VapB family antitoxin [Gemmatimonadota bacterium]